LATALVVAASGVLVRTIGAALDPFQQYPGHTADYGVERTRAIRAALPGIVDRPEKTVIVLGSSGLARAFVPSVFDAALDRGTAHHASFYVAQLLLQPETALAMAEVIRDGYAARDKRLWITIFGISVPELTRDALRAARHRMPDQAFAFESAAGLKARAGTNPLGAFGDGFQLLVYGNVRPSRIGLWIEDWMAARPAPCESGLKQPQTGEAAQAALDVFCNELHKQFPRGVPPWNPNTRGGIDFGLPLTRDSLERLIEVQPSSASSPGVTLAAQSTSQRAPDNIDADAVRMLIAAVRELGTVSDRVFVLRDVMNPDLLTPIPPAQLVQWREVAERIAREGGARLLDFNDGTFVPCDFGDRTHLHPIAAERFSSLLAARIQSTLEEHRASR
jgi:hypothetical protein